MKENDNTKIVFVCAKILVHKNLVGTMFEIGLLKIGSCST